MLDETTDDEPSLGDKEAALIEPAGFTDVGIRRYTTICEGGNLDHCFAK